MMIINLCIYFACLGICLFVSNKPQDSSTNRANIFWGIFATDKIRFFKILKIHKFVHKIREILFWVQSAVKA